MSDIPRPLVELRGVTKAFPGVVALEGVTFELLPGEVHALVGENGAGKSTLGKIVCGVHQPDAGTLRFGGRPVVLPSPRAAQELGVAVIYQEPALFPDLSVLENLFAGVLFRQGWWVDWPRMRREAQTIIDSLDVALDLTAPVGHLSAAQQQLVEIARALLRKAHVFIMDEPTAPLAQKEVETLFRLIRQLKGRGAGTIYISHRLEEVFEVADRVTVLRDGHQIITAPAADLTRDVLIGHMVGRVLDTLFPKTPVPFGAPALTVRDLSLGSILRGISFDVRQGEIVGIAGLVGSGRTTLAHAIFGITPPDRGQILLGGREVRIGHPGQAIGMGITYIPEDRQRQGLILPFPVQANLSLVILRQLARRGFVDRAAEETLARQLVARLDIRTPGVDTPASNLSGGNQQKVVVGKWLASQPTILIMDEPTRGIDVGAKAEIHRLMNELVGRGMAILLISSELPELLGMCDRILVMHRGGITGQVVRQEATQEKVMALATGSA